MKFNSCIGVWVFMVSWFLAPANAVGQTTPPSQEFFNGKDLTGWSGQPRHWKVVDGAIVGAPVKGVKAHTFLCSDQLYGDFELSFKVRRKNGAGNSGVQIRSSWRDRSKFLLTGPQIEIDSASFAIPPGSVVHEPTAQPSFKSNPAVIDRVWKDADFNDMHIRCVGSHVTVKIGGEVVVDTDYPDMPSEGIIAFQLHGSRPPQEIVFKDIKFTDLTSRRPTPAVAAAGKPASASAELVKDSVWTGKATPKKPAKVPPQSMDLIVSDRDGDKFSGELRYAGRTLRRIAGTVDGNKIQWDGAPGESNPGWHNTGTISGKRIEVKYLRTKDSPVEEGTFVLELRGTDVASGLKPGGPTVVGNRAAPKTSSPFPSYAKEQTVEVPSPPGKLSPDENTLLRLASIWHYVNGERISGSPARFARQFDLIAREGAKPGGAGDLGRLVLAFYVFNTSNNQNKAEREQMLSRFSTEYMSVVANTAIDGLTGLSDISNFQEWRKGPGRGLEVWVDNLRRNEVGKWSNIAATGQTALNIANSFEKLYTPRLGAKALDWDQMSATPLGHDQYSPAIGKFVELNYRGDAKLTNVVVVGRLHTKGASVALTAAQLAIVKFNDGFGYKEQNRDVVALFKLQNFVNSTPKGGITYVPELKSGDRVQITLGGANAEGFTDVTVAVYSDQGKFAEKTVDFNR